MGVLDLFSVDNLTRVVDTAVAIYNPEIAARRSKLRTAMRLYDGATVGRRGDGFRPIAEGPRDNNRQLAILRQRSRDFSRNNGYAIKAVHGIASNMVGTGIVRNIKTIRKNGKSEYQDLWKRWSESTACDFEGLNTFAGLQELAVKTIVESGEVFIRRRVEDSKYFARTKQIPLKIQILDAEFLNESKDTGGLAEGNTIASGIEFNADGQRVAYHIYKRHPSSGLRPESTRILASEIVHVFRIDRPGQIRGVPWGAPVMLNLSDFDAYEDAHLVAKKVAACFAGFITQPEVDDTIGENPEVDSYVDRMEPGMLEILPAGKEITFGNPPPSTGYAEYTDKMLHKIAAGYQVPYSVLTGDFSKVNFSSGRMGWLEFQRLIDQWRWNMMVPRMLDPIWAWWVDLAEVLGYPSSAVTADWTAPRREMIDPSKEITATLESVKGGLTSMPEAIREMGYDPDVTLSEIKDWNAKIDADKIILDSDPRQDPKRLAAENIAKQKVTV